MPRVVPGERKRSFQPKTKTGCQTCRRVKCDEERPSCRKCSSTGRKCEGASYGNSYASPQAQENTSPEPKSERSSPDLSIVLMKSLSLEPNRTQNESRAFCFFIQNTAPQLSGFYGEAFWDKLLLQAVHYEPVIHHAIVALGSLHEKFMLVKGATASLGNELCRGDHFALQHYNFAIRSLVKPLAQKERPAMDVCLTACILFACFETMQGSYGRAISHLQSGIKILGEIQYDEETNSHRHEVLTCANSPHVPMSILLEMYMRLDYQITDMIGGRKWSLFKKFAEYRAQKSDMDISLPIKFSSLSEARDALNFHRFRASYAITHLGQLKVEDFDLALATWKYENDSVLTAWNSAFEKWQHNHEGSMTELERRGVKVLGILKNMCYVSLHIIRQAGERPHEDDQTAWDMFNPEFEATVSLAEDVLLSSYSSAEALPTPTFSLDMEIVGPLYGVASRCRDPYIRRRAIYVLQSCARQEGMWNAALTARVAERLVKLEEEGLGEVKSCADVPDWARISHVMPAFEKEGQRRATLSYRRLGSKHDVVRRTVEEVLEW